MKIKNLLFNNSLISVLNGMRKNYRMETSDRTGQICFKFQLEKFKSNQSPKNALHSKFHLLTGEPVTKDEEFEHLQIDNVALFLLFMVQMIESGLQVGFKTSM